MNAEPLPSSSTTPSATRSSASRPRLAPAALLALAAVAVLVAAAAAAAAAAAPAAPARAASSSVAPSSASASSSASTSASGSLSAGLARRGAPRLRPARVGLGLLGLLGRSAVLARLLGDDRVDQVGLAQAAEAVDAELVGDQVKVGERAALERVAVQDGRHGTPWDGRMAARPRCAQRPATRASHRVAAAADRRRHVAVGVALRRQALGGRQLALAAQHRADREEVGRRRHVVHPQDVRAGVGRPADRRQRRGAALARRAARDRAEEVLARDRQQQRPARARAARRAAAAPRPSARASWRSPGPGSRISCSGCTPAASARAIRSARKSRTSATTSS